MHILYREECCLVHESEFWNKLEESESMNQEDREKIAKGFHQIYLNQDSVLCAR